MISKFFKSLKNKFYNFCMAGNFKKDSLGREIYFPSGPRSHGYVVTDRVKCERLQIILPILTPVLLISIPLLASFDIRICAAAMSGLFLLYYLVRRDTLKGMEKSDEVLTYKEYLQAHTPITSLPFLIFVEGCSLYLIATSIFHLWLGTSSRFEDDIFLLLYAFVIAVFNSYFLWTKIRDLRASNLLPATRKGIVFFALVNCVKASLIYLVFCACIFAMIMMYRVAS